MKVQAKHISEYLLVRGFDLVFWFLPHRLSLCLGWLVAKGLYRLPSKRIRSAKRRIREVFGQELPESQVDRIAWISLRNLVFNAIELFRMGKVDQPWIEHHVDTEGFMQKLRATVKPGRGAIVAVPHMGNWDLGGVGLHLLGWPVFTFAAKQSNPLTTRLLTNKRSRGDMECLLRDENNLRKVVKYLREGKILAYPIDLRAPKKALSVRFLGKQANIGSGLGFFARQANVPVLPTYVVREGWSKHKWVALDPIWPDSGLAKDKDRQRMVQHALTLFEEPIRENPEQYFWYNKRWVLEPLG